MGQVNYQIGLKEMEQVIDLSKDYLDWTGFVPVSAELQKKIILCHEDFEKRIYKIEGEAREGLDREYQRYNEKVKKLVDGRTRIPITGDLIGYVSCDIGIISYFDNYRRLKIQLDKGELEIDVDDFDLDAAKQLVKCPKLKATRVTCTRGRWYDFKMVEASRNSDGFDMTLFAPTPRHSRNYKMLKQYAELEGAVRILCI